MAEGPFREVSRRESLIALAGIAALGASGCAPIGAALHGRGDRKVARLPADRQFLDRVTYGWSLRESERLAALGKGDYIALQLEAGQEEPLHLTLQLSQLDCLRLGGAELMDLPRARVIEQLQAAAILHAVYSPNQLRERMIDFWSNHFNVYSGKADGAFFKGVQERTIIRQHALGKFADLAREMMHSPAMLVYLDNQLNSEAHPNENYARELMELHTLGVHGGYTQRDIQEVARCLTGWGMETGFLEQRGAFKFNQAVHDNGEKVVLGHKIAAGGGKSDGDEVLKILLDHPATPKHLARKLVVYFCGQPNAELEAKVAGSYDSIPGMVRPILESPHLTAAPPRLRRPFEYLCAALRYSDATTSAGAPLQLHLQRMGQLAYDWPMPDGYPVDELSWNGSMLPRWKFAAALARSEIRGTDVESTDDLLRTLLSPEFQSA